MFTKLSIKLLLRAGEYQSVSSCGLNTTRHLAIMHLACINVGKHMILDTHHHYYLNNHIFQTGSSPSHLFCTYDVTYFRRSHWYRVCLHACPNHRLGSGCCDDSTSLCISASLDHWFKYQHFITQSWHKKTKSFVVVWWAIIKVPLSGPGPRLDNNGLFRKRVHITCCNDCTGTCDLAMGIINSITVNWGDPMIRIVHEWCALIGFCWHCCYHLLAASHHLDMARTSLWRFEDTQHLTPRFRTTSYGRDAYFSCAIHEWHILHLHHASMNLQRPALAHGLLPIWSSWGKPAVEFGCWVRTHKHYFSQADRQGLMNMHKETIWRKTCSAPCPKFVSANITGVLIQRKSIQQRDFSCTVLLPCAKVDKHKPCARHTCGGA